MEIALEAQPVRPVHHLSIGEVETGSVVLGVSRTRPGDASDRVELDAGRRPVFSADLQRGGQAVRADVLKAVGIADTIQHTQSSTRKRPPAPQ